MGQPTVGFSKLTVSGSHFLGRVWKWGGPCFGGVWTLRIQVCPIGRYFSRKNLFCGWDFLTINPIRSGGEWILRVRPNLQILHEIIWLILMVNVGKYTSPMDPMGSIIIPKRFDSFSEVHQGPKNPTVNICRDTRIRLPTSCTHEIWRIDTEKMEVWKMYMVILGMSHPWDWHIYLRTYIGSFQTWLFWVYNHCCLVSFIQKRLSGKACSWWIEWDDGTAV